MFDEEYFDEFYAKLNDIVNSAFNLGEVYDQSKIVRKILRSMVKWLIGWHVWLMDELHIRKSWRHVRRIRKVRRCMSTRVNAIDGQTSQVLQITE